MLTRARRSIAVISRRPRAVSKPFFAKSRAISNVPQLLVRSARRLRDVARAVYESGLRLDAAGDWLGALQKFEQPGQIHPEVKGLPDAVKRVREKLSTAVKPRSCAPAASTRPGAGPTR
jgi:hypothetical protein